MNYEEALDYLHGLSRYGIRLGLERMAYLLEALGHPERQYPVVHLAGTNGKGSASAMLASILQAAGYRTGLYTSPHLVRYTERIRVDGREISPAETAGLIGELVPLVEAGVARGLEHPTEFEVGTALMYEYCRRQGVEVLVQEAGLGGRLDSTNLVVSPAATAITSVDLDHMDRLGPDLASIAAEKAGIIKPGSPLVTGFLAPEARQVVARRVAETGVRWLGVGAAGRAPNTGARGEIARIGSAAATGFAEMTRPTGTAGRAAPIEGAAAAPQPLDYTILSLGGDGAEFRYSGPRLRLDRLHIPLLGSHQVHNAAVALGLVEVLQDAGWVIGEEAIRRGLAGVRWPGRLERLAGEPVTFLDGAHNPAAAAAVVRALREVYPDRPFTLVLGILADKDVTGVLRELLPLRLPGHGPAGSGDSTAGRRKAEVMGPHDVPVPPQPVAGRVFATEVDSPRSLPAARLAEEIRRHGVEPVMIEDPAEAVRRARQAAGSNGAILVAGSFYLVGAVRGAFVKEGQQ